MNHYRSSLVSCDKSGLLIRPNKIFKKERRLGFCINWSTLFEYSSSVKDECSVFDSSFLDMCWYRCKFADMIEEVLLTKSIKIKNRNDLFL